MLILKILHRARIAALFESEDPWASEVIGYANGAAGLAAFFSFWLVAKLSSVPSLALSILLLLLLRLSLARRVTTLFAAVVSTVFLSVIAGGLAWMLAQCIEVRAVPEIVAIVAGLLAGAVPAHAYQRFLAAHATAGNTARSAPDPRRA